MTATNRVGGPISAPELDNRSDGRPEEPCHRGRDRNGRWMRRFDMRSSTPLLDV